MKEDNLEGMKNVVKNSIYSEDRIINSENIDSNVDSTQNCGVHSAFDLYNNDIIEIPMLLGNVLPKVGLVGLIGDSDTGKSTLLRHLGLSIINESPTFLKWDLNGENRKVLYVSLEDEYFATSANIKKPGSIIEDTERLKRMKYIFESDNLLNDIDKEIEKEPVDIIIIDPLGELFDGDSNSLTVMRNTINDFYKIATKRKCCIILNHHVVKNRGDKPASKDQAVGSHAFGAKLRTVLHLQNVNSNSAEKYLSIVKGNYTPNSEKRITSLISMNENFIYDLIDGEIPIENISKMNNKTNDLIFIENVMDKRKQNKSYRDIALEMTQEGFPISKDAVGKIVKKNLEN